MSAINPVVQTPPRSNPDPFNSGAGQTTAPTAQQGFSDTLHSVGAKPVRKSTSSRAQRTQGSGDSLPATGNHSPSAPPVASSRGSVNAGAPVSPPAASPAPTAAVAGSTGLIGSAAVSTGAGQTANAALGTSAANATGAAIAANATVANAAPALDALSAAGAASAPDVAGGSKDAAANNAAAIGSSGTQNSLPGPTGEIPQSAVAATSAVASTAPPTDGAPIVASASAVTANAAPAGQAPTTKAAPRAADTTTSNWIAVRSAAAMRAIYPTGNSGAATTGKVLTGTGSQDPGMSPPSAPSAATTPAAQIDTAAMIGAMQANSAASSASSAEPNPAMPPGNASDTAASPLNGVGANNDVLSALPAMAAAAARAAQVVSTVAAGAAADKKSHDAQSQIASASGASSTADTAGAAQLLNAQGAVHADGGAVPTFKVNAAVDSPDFSQNVASHISTMFDGNVNSAKLQVNPPALGPIEVRISIQGDHAQVWMASHSAMTRDALQDAAPQLREMLNSQGFAQVSVDISQRSFQERTPTAHAYEWNAESNAASTSASAGTEGITSRASSGTLDAYA